MTTFSTFEEIGAWKEARILIRSIYNASNTGPFSRDYPFRDQARRASVSILANIAEGFERSGTAEFVNFLAIAKGSAGEVRALLYVALDQGYITEDSFRKLTDLTIKIIRMIGSLMIYLRKSGIKGKKYQKVTPKADGSASKET
jgi:four helix bundle protein